VRALVTGAAGFIGAHVAAALADAGASVRAFDSNEPPPHARVDDWAKGDLLDPASIKTAMDGCDAVFHLAAVYSYYRRDAGLMLHVNSEGTRNVLAAAGHRRVVHTSSAATCGPVQGRPATEDDPSPFHGPDSPRGGAENLAFEFVDRGVRTVSLRFAPTVHGVGDHGFIAAIAGVARAKGVSGYPGDGTNRWAAVHRSDAARLVALGLAKAPAGSRLHAVAEEGIPSRQIAEAIGHALGLPVTSVDPDDVQDHFGWIGGFFAMSLTATSDRTRELLGWTPTGPTLSEDLAAGAYGTAVRA